MFKTLFSKLNPSLSKANTISDIDEHAIVFEKDVKASDSSYFPTALDNQTETIHSPFSLPRFSTSGSLSSIETKNNSTLSVPHSNLRLRAQYIFNVYEDASKSRDELQIEQNVQNSILPASFFSPKNTAPYTSFSLRNYLKTFLAGTLLFLVFTAGKLFYSDYQNLVNTKIQDRQEILSKCIEDYTINDCSNPIDKIEQMCNDWFKCMQEDPRKFERSTLAAELLGRIVASFFSVLSLRELLLATFSLFFASFIFLTGFKVLQRFSNL